MIHKNYKQFLEELNKNKLEWCLIKDYEFLNKKSYDNEIDLISKSKYKQKITKIAKKQGWYGSSLNYFNTHLIFWKFEKGIPYRIDIHLDKALATSIPWIDSKNILKTKIKDKNGIWYLRKDYELAILMIAHLRGRIPKKHRIQRANELQAEKNNAFKILKSKLKEEEYRKYTKMLIEGKRVKLSAKQRLGIKGKLELIYLYPKLLLARIIQPAKIYHYKGNKQNFNIIINKLKRSKLNIKVIHKNTTFKTIKIIINKIISDLVIIADTSSKSSSNQKTNNIISQIYPNKNDT